MGVVSDLHSWRCFISTFKYNQELFLTHGCSRVPARPCHALPTEQSSAAPAKRRGTEAKLGERRAAKAGLAGVANKHYPSLGSAVRRAILDIRSVRSNSPVSVLFFFTSKHIFIVSGVSRRIGTRTAVRRWPYCVMDVRRWPYCVMQQLVSGHWCCSVPPWINENEPLKSSAWMGNQFQLKSNLTADVWFDIMYIYPIIGRTSINKNKISFTYVHKYHYTSAKSNQASNQSKRRVIINKISQKSSWNTYYSWEKQIILPITTMQEHRTTSTR